MAITMSVRRSGWAAGLVGIAAACASAPCCDAQSVSAAATLPMHLEAAQQYRLYSDSSRVQTLKLNERPLFVWTNPRRAGGQVGHLFV